MPRKKKSDPQGPYRATYVAIFDTLAWQKLSSSARLAWHGLRYYPQGLWIGLHVFYAEPLQMQTGLPVPELLSALDELERGGWIQREGNLLWLVHALELDPSCSLDSESVRTGVLRALRKLSPLPILHAFCERYGIDDSAEAWHPQNDNTGLSFRARAHPPGDPGGEGPPHPPGDPRGGQEFLSSNSNSKTEFQSSNSHSGVEGDDPDARNAWNYVLENLPDAGRTRDAAGQEAAERVVSRMGGWEALSRGTFHRSTRHRQFLELYEQETRAPT